MILYDDNRYITIIKSEYLSYPDRGKWEKESNYLKLIPYEADVETIEFEIKGDELKIQGQEMKYSFSLQKMKMNEWAIYWKFLLGVHL